MATLAILTWITLLQVVIIRAKRENLDPVYFSFSANNPKNTSLIPLPKHFDKFGDENNDCCTLALFFEVKDLNMQGSGNDPPEMEGAQAQTATFKFEHTHIRDTDKIFTMDVPMSGCIEPCLVKARHILNFNNCSTIIYKTFDIFATTSVTDEKDVKVILVNGKDDNIKCQVPHVPHAIKPVLETDSKSEETPVLKAEVGGIALVISTIAFVIATIAILLYVVKCNSPKNNMEAIASEGDVSDPSEIPLQDVCNGSTDVPNNDLSADTATSNGAASGAGLDEVLIKNARDDRRSGRARKRLNK